MKGRIVDGDNSIHAGPALKATLRDRGLEEARRQLVPALAEYAAQTGIAVTVVFDGAARKGPLPATEQHDGVTVLFVEHDMDIVARYAQRVLAFYEGRILADGGVASVLGNEEVRRYVIGGAHAAAGIPEAGGA